MPRASLFRDNFVDECQHSRKILRFSLSLSSLKWVNKVIPPHTNESPAVRIKADAQSFIHLKLSMKCLELFFYVSTCSQQRWRVNEYQISWLRVTVSKYQMVECGSGRLAQKWLSARWICKYFELNIIIFNHGIIETVKRECESNMWISEYLLTP